jgi:hypothetical protein
MVAFWSPPGVLGYTRGMSRRPDAGEPREVFLRVRLAPFEAKSLDRIRGRKTRSDYVRGLLAEDAQRKGLGA